MRIPITIRVSGPGQTFDGLFNEIQDFLLFKNPSLIIKNEYPSPAPLNADWNRYEVTLVANHCPWGG